ncbi:hypothetical protein STIAU_7485, partial [Stigmatella aurantiaca DW4/3-1]
RECAEQRPQQVILADERLDQDGVHPQGQDAGAHSAISGSFSASR